MRSRSDPRAVSTRMGMEAVAVSRRSSRQMVRPSRSGRLRSRMTKSKPPRWTSTRASWPRLKCVMVYPSRWRLRLMVNARSESSSTRAIRFGMNVLDHFAFDEVNNHLADIGCSVSHSLEILADERETDRARDIARIFEHVRQQLAKRLLGLLIDAVVHGDHLTRQIAVAAHERVERLTDHRLRVLGEPGNGDHRFELRLAIELDGP